MLLPAAIVVVLSISNDSFFHFPPDHYGLRQYNTLLASAYWQAAIIKSFQVAFPSATLALLIGIPGVIGMNRTSLPFRQALQGLSLVPLIVPGVAYAMGIYAFYLQLHDLVPLIGTWPGLVFSHTILALPYVILIVGSAINRIPEELELAAMSLGASRLRAMIEITLRLILPAVGAAFVFAFLASFDEATIVNFISGPSLITLPKAIFDSLNFGIDPVITAIATILMLVTGLAATVAVYWRR